MMKVKRIILMLAGLCMAVVLSGCLDQRQFTDRYGNSMTEGRYKNSATSVVTIQGQVEYPAEYESQDKSGVLVTLAPNSSQVSEAGDDAAHCNVGGALTVKTNANGGYEFAEVKKGVYTLCIAASLDTDEVLGKIVTGITVDANDLLDENGFLKLDRLKISKAVGGLFVELTVIDADTGNPVPHALVRINGSGSSDSASGVGGTTDKNGFLQYSTLVFETTTFSGSVAEQVIVEFVVDKEFYQTNSEKITSDGSEYQAAFVVIALQKRLPVQIGSDTDWSAVEAGPYHLVALKTTGELYAWGDYSQAGNLQGSAKYDRTPRRIGNDSDWARIRTAHTDNYLFKGDGSLWKLTDGVTLPDRIGQGNWKDISGSLSWSLGIKSTTSLWYWDSGYFSEVSGYGLSKPDTTPEQVGSSLAWSSVSAGLHHAVLLKEDHSLWTVGDNYYGQLGRETLSQLGQVGSNMQWKAVTAGNVLSVAIASDGTLWAWGAFQMGGEVRAPTQVSVDTDWDIVASNNIIGGYSSIMLIKADGSLWFWSNWSDEPFQIGSDYDWSDVTVGANQITVLKDNGTLWSW